MSLHVSALCRIVTQLRFREKLFYLKLTTFSVAGETKLDAELISYSESASKIKWGHLNSFRNFVYVSSYLHLNTFTWKRDYIISQKLQMPQVYPNHSKKLLLRSVGFMCFDGLNTTHSFIKGSWVLSNFGHLNCYKNWEKLQK